MGATTAIAWTDHTFNPWWGCSRVSPGCQHCYAETFAKRTGHDVWGNTAERRFFGDQHWLEPLKWNAAAEAAGRPALVFCASMADVFEDRPDVAGERERLWSLVTRTPHLIWQLLTKRPENVAEMVPVSWSGWTHLGIDNRPPEWPPNVWIGTTVEDQQRADERVPVLLDLPAPVRFLSAEPLLGPIKLRPEWWAEIGWIIIGGESGPGHRPLVEEHALELAVRALAFDVPLFFKQHGGRTPTAGGCLLDLGTGPAEWKDFPAAAGR